MKTVMNAPPHPGAILREDVLPELGLTVAGAARQLRVSRAMLSRILSGHAGISAETALRMENGWAVRALKAGCDYRWPMICGMSPSILERWRR